MLEALQRLAPALLRHLVGYGELLCEEAGDALRQSRRRALGLAVTVGAGVMALMLACVWAIAASWDGPNRLVVVGVLCIGFATVSLIGMVHGRRARSAGPAPFDRLKAEWRADLRELAQLDPSIQLHRSMQGSREELFLLAHVLKGDRKLHENPEGFPRSRIMRALTGEQGRKVLGQAAMALAMSRPKAAWRLAGFVPLLRPLIVRFLAGRLLRSRRPESTVTN
jgi:hypothetical protein